MHERHTIVCFSSLFYVTVWSRGETTEDILVVRTAVSVLVVVVVMMVRSGVVVFLIQGRWVGGAEAFPLLLCFLQDTAVGQSAEPAQQLPIHLWGDSNSWDSFTLNDRWSCESVLYLSPAFLLAVKGALLFALFAGLWGAIFFLWVSTALALCPNKRCNDVTVLAGFGL